MGCKHNAGSNPVRETKHNGVGKIVVVYLTVNQGARVRFPPSPQYNLVLSTGVRRALIKRGDWPDGRERHGFESLGDYQTIWPRRINGGAPVSKTG